MNLASAFAVPALTVYVRGDVVLEKTGAVVALDGGSVTSFGMFVCATPKTLLEFTLLYDAAVFFRFCFSGVAEETAAVSIGFLLSAVVVLHDLLGMAKPVFLVVDGRSKPESGLDNCLE